MTHNPFILYELDFDSELFRKHYGVIENPGIYAIPEDEVNPGTSFEDNPQNNTSSEVDQGDIAQSEKDKEVLVQTLSHQEDLPQLQLSQDELNAIDREVTPVKKMFLLNKLYQLSYLLKSKLMANEELETILKFGSLLSYKTLQFLTINILNALKAQAQQEGQQGNQYVQQEV